MLKLHCRFLCCAVSLAHHKNLFSMSNLIGGIILDLVVPNIAFGMRSGGSGGNVGGGMSRGSYSGAKGGRMSSYPYTGISGLGNEYDRVSPNVKKAKDATTPKSTGRNISTPQIVFILTLIMSLGFAGYYLIQFYPFLCSSEKKYDVMTRSSVTPTHSREFEYDESTSSATKSTNASYSNENEHDV